LGGCHAATGKEVVDEHDGLPPRRWPWSEDYVVVGLDPSEVVQGAQELDHAHHVLSLIVPDLYLAQVEEADDLCLGDRGDLFQF